MFGQIIRIFWKSKENNFEFPSFRKPFEKLFKIIKMMKIYISKCFTWMEIETEYEGNFIG